MRAQHLYEFGPYRLDTAEQRLLRDGKPVPLTPKAFETLLALVERNGHLVEKEELMKVVWADAFVEESNLTNNVSALRRLLGKGKSGQSYIETVPKRGYRFTAPVKELPPDTLVVEKRTLTRVVTEETVAGESSLKPVIGAPEALIVEQSRIHTKPAKWHWLLFVLLSVSFVIAGFFIYRSLTSAPRQIESIAVLPFKNESGNADVEYLSDGVTETLINSLSQLSNLSVKARSSVFDYKDKAVEPQIVAAELSVQAILTGRVVQRGEDLTLYLSLVDGRNGNQLWGQRYDRKLADLVALQNEIARDVSQKVRSRLTPGDEQKLAKTYTANAEAYQLYLRGRHHYSRLTRPEINKGIAYYQQAIAIDQSYALAYTGLSQAYRTLALTSDVPSNETLPKAKAAALRALEIDGTLAEAHSALGAVALWYDWDWKAAEKHYLRALELDPNGTPMGYAQLLYSLGQHEKALIEAKRARERDPLNLRISATEGQALFFAGRYEEAIDRLQKTIELEPNFWLSHLFLSRVYIEKRMYPEAVTEAAKARDLSGGNSEAIAHLVYSLAKAGKQKEARITLDELKKRAAERYVPPYAFALSYNGLGETDQAIAWLERGFEERDVKMTLLVVDPKWNNLRADQRFQELLGRVGLPL